MDLGSVITVLCTVMLFLLTMILKILSDLKAELKGKVDLKSCEKDHLKVDIEIKDLWGAVNKLRGV